MFTSMCVPSAYLADSSVAESAGGSLKPPEAARGVCKLYLFGAPASLSRHLGWISSEGEFPGCYLHSCHGVGSWAVTVARQDPMAASESLWEGVFCFFFS